MARYRQLAASLEQPETLVARWAERLAQSSVPALPGRGDARESFSSISSLVEELARALSGPPDEVDGDARPGDPIDLAPGSRATRELEKSAALVGASQAGRGGGSFEVAAAILALRDLAREIQADERETLDALFDWLLVVAMDAFASGKASAVAERHAAYLEQNTPMVMVTPVLPALLLMGAPDRLVLDRIFSKLLLAVVRVGARVAIVDANGLPEPSAPLVLESLTGFVNHRKIQGRLHLQVLGLDRAHERAWSEVCAGARIPLEHHELFAQAVARALDIIDHEIRPRSG